MKKLFALIFLLSSLASAQQMTVTEPTTKDTVRFVKATQGLKIPFIVLNEVVLTSIQPLDADLTALAALSTTGMLSRTGSATYSLRTLTAGYGVDISNGDGVSGNPTVTVDTTNEIATLYDVSLKADIASPTFTGTVTIPTPFTLGAVSVTPTGTELNFVDGVTSDIQTQLDGKADLTETEQVRLSNTANDVFGDTASFANVIASGYVVDASAINVRSHGATGDGSTDDATAFANALLALSGDKRVLYIPPGNYKIGTALTLRDSIEIVGAGLESRLFTASAINLFVAPSGISYVAIRNLAMAGVDSSSGVSNHEAINVSSSATNVVIKNCEFRNFVYGVDLASPVNCYIAENNFYGCSYAAVLTNNGKLTTVYKNFVDGERSGYGGNGLVGLFITTSGTDTANVVSTNFVRNVAGEALNIRSRYSLIVKNVAMGSFATGIMVEGGSTEAENAGSYNQFIGNRVVSPENGVGMKFQAVVGVETIGVHDNIVRNNFIYVGGNGIQIGVSDSTLETVYTTRITLKDNRVMQDRDIADGTNTVGIYVYKKSDNNIIEDNEVTGFKTQGVGVYSNRNSVLSNEIWDNGRNGIEVGDAITFRKHNSINGNIIWDNGKLLASTQRSGILLNGSADSTDILGNKIWNTEDSTTMDTGIRFATGVSGARVIDNVVQNIATPLNTNSNTPLVVNTPASRTSFILGETAGDSLLTILYGATIKRGLLVGERLSVGGQILSSAGTTSAPGISFSGATNAGFILSGGTDIYVVRASSVMLRFQAGSISINSTNAFNWVTDNAGNIGGSTGNRPSNGYFRSSLNVQKSDNSYMFTADTTGTTIGSSGTEITKIIGASLVYDCGSIAAGVDSSFSITVTGALAGNPVIVGVSVAREDGLEIEVECVTNDVVRVILHNANLVSAIDPASRTYKVLVTNF